MNEKTKARLKLAAKIAVLLIILTLIIINYDKLKNIDIRQMTAGKSLTLSAFIILGVYAVKSVLFVIPAMLLYTSVGVAFPPLYAVLINITGICLEVTITYFIGRFLGDEYVRNLLQKNKGGQKILEKQIENRFPALLIIRALPVFPIDFLSLFLGSIKSNLLVYFLASVIGIAPRVILFTLLGEGIYDYIPMDIIIKAVIIIIPLAVIAFLIRYFINKKKSE